MCLSMYLRKILLIDKLSNPQKTVSKPEQSKISSTNSDCQARSKVPRVEKSLFSFDHMPVLGSRDLCVHY